MQGVTSYFDWVQKMLQYHVRDCADRITCPALICYADQEVRAHACVVLGFGVWGLQVFGGLGFGAWGGRDCWGNSWWLTCLPPSPRSCALSVHSPCFSLILTRTHMHPPPSVLLPLPSWVANPECNPRS